MINLKLSILPRDLLEFYTIAQEDEKLIQDHHQAEYNIKSNFLAELTVHWNFENLILPSYIGANSFRCLFKKWQSSKFVWKWY